MCKVVTQRLERRLLWFEDMRTLGSVQLLVEQANADGQDRAAHYSVGDRDVVVVADGAGGIGGGAMAAESVVREVAEAVRARRLGDWCSVLREVDVALRRAGETTALVVEIGGDEIVGASVGDSEAWVLSVKRMEQLTRRQRRRPLVGSGEAIPVPFVATWLGSEVLVLGSDGLFKYTAVDRIAGLLVGNASCADLIDLVRLPSGRLQDDATVVACRR